jgi:O-antigen ligase
MGIGLVYTSGPFVTADRLTRILVLASAAGALALQTVLGARAWGPLRVWTPAVFVAAWVLTRVAPRAARAVLLAAASVFPALVLTLAGGFEPAHLALWTAAILGLVTGTSGFSGWSLPPAWRLSLGTWALAVAAVWPVVAWREVDFSASLLDNYHVSVTGIGIAPPIEVLWIAHIAAMHLVGLLWLDSLFRVWAGDDVQGFERQVAWPLAAGAFAGAAVGLYQAFGHLAVLSAGSFAADGRATGAMLDANAFGLISAIWAIGLVVLVQSQSPLRRLVVLSAATVLAAGTWVSGSRDALAALAIAGLGLLFGMWRSRPRWALVSAIGAVGIAGALLVAVRSGGLHPSAVGPIGRFLAMLPASREPALQPVLSELWNRNGYGAMAVRMVREFPLTGIGVGAFNAIVVDYAAVFIGQLTPDNAQNWFRHQLAEFGVLGSVGWIVWVAMFLWLLVKRAPRPSNWLSLYALKGMVVAIGVASLVGMPTQNDVVLLTFWAVVFWLALVAGAVPRAARSRPVAGGAWLGAIFLVAAFVGATARMSVEHLRVPFRAMRADWDFAYGLAPEEHLPDGTPFRWTGLRAVWVEASSQPFVRVTYWVNHPDVADHPVHVQVSDATHSVVDVLLRDTAPHVIYLRIVGWAAPGQAGWHTGAGRLMLQVEVDRTWRPSRAGQADTRDLGLAVSLKSVCCVPVGAFALDMGPKTP